MYALIEQLHNLDNTLSPSEIREPIINYWNYAYGHYQIYPRIICLNLQSKNTKHTRDFFDVIKKYKPHIIFTMENWKLYPNLDNYVRFTTKSIHMNHLYIRNDIIRNRSLQYIQYGFRFEDICFRYIPPNSSETTLYQNEIGDFNFNSNRWSKKYLDDFYREKRFGIPGGLGFRLNKLHNYSFFQTSADHMGLYIQINEPFKCNPLADKRKIDLAIEDINNNRVQDFEYIYKYNRNYKYKMCNDIINPNIFDFKDWENLYKHDDDKIDLQSNNIGMGILDKHLGTKAYDANNRPIKMIVESLNKLNTTRNELVKFNQIINKDPCNARVICLRKKNDVQSLNDVRPIVILPTGMKIRENTRKILKEELKNRIDNRIVSFMEGKSVHNCLSFLINNIMDNG
jgi:hypothetical protein